MLTISYKVPQLLSPVVSALQPFLESLLQRGLERFANLAKSYKELQLDLVEYFGRFRHRTARVHCSILGTTAPILLTVEHFSSLAAYSGCLSAGNMMVNKNYN
ncbi:unnamed protein product [Vicia faba]|uniref:Uncharacterized protein n=1 Tax=Vicia faba TaxID=3906 RepID=A0AAV0Z2F3_VICFA|nr:unnamed protein product [Vicia faba]